MPKMKKAKVIYFGFLIGPRRRPTLPHKRSCSTIGAKELNFRVRDGIGWDLRTIVTDQGDGVSIGGFALRRAPEGVRMGVRVVACRGTGHTRCESRTDN